jgi:hypothetical protein
VNPVARTSHLKVADEGIALLNSIDGPVVPVVVIGPYRSGKSFLLNQLLGVPCSEYAQLLRQQQAWLQQRTAEPLGCCCLGSSANHLRW